MCYWHSGSEVGAAQVCFTADKVMPINDDVMVDRLGWFIYLYFLSDGTYRAVDLVRISSAVFFLLNTSSLVLEQGTHELWDYKDNPSVTMVMMIHYGTELQIAGSPDKHET